MSKYISVVSMSFIFGLGIACSSDIAREIEVVDGKRTIAMNELFPLQFSAEHIKQFSTNKCATSGVSFAIFTLDTESSIKFQSAIPYKLQVLTGTWSKFAANITKVEGSERRVDLTKLVATYQFTSPYISYNNVQFDVALEGKTYNLVDSVLGENDFMSSLAQPITNSSFFYIASTDEQFVRESNSLHRLNLNISKWLLICAQLQGEDIYRLDESGRQIKGQELFQSFLTEKNYTLNSNNLLTMDQYVDCMTTLQKRILAYHGVCAEDVPNTTEIEQFMQISEGKVFVKARVGA